MTIDEKVELARKIANHLIGVTSSEWSKWVFFVKAKGLHEAIGMANTLARSLSLRPGPRRSYEAIGNAITRFKQLKGIPMTDLIEILGYTRRWLISRRGLIQVEEEGPSRQ